MNEAELKRTLERAIVRLFEHQPSIFEFTSETSQTEWNLAHHLAIELHGLFPGLDCDIDVMKLNYENRRPDIILHKRGTHKSNYLVVEVKRNGNPRQIDEDIAKIRTHWFRGALHYEFGAVIDLRTNGNHVVQVFENTH